MMTSSNVIIFRVRGVLRGNSPVTDEFSSQRPPRFSLIYSCINGWVNNFEAEDLRCLHDRYDVIVMYVLHILYQQKLKSCIVESILL